MTEEVVSNEVQSEDDRTLTIRIQHRGAREAAEIVAAMKDDESAVEILRSLNPAMAQDILAELDEERVTRLLASVTPAAPGTNTTRAPSRSSSTPTFTALSTAVSGASPSR